MGRSAVAVALLGWVDVGQEDMGVRRWVSAKGSKIKLAV
jgi:hypothetical protein